MIATAYANESKTKYEPKHQSIEITENDYQIFEEKVEELISLGENLTEKQVKELKTYISVMQRYEDACLLSKCQINLDVPPHIILKQLMDLRQLKQKDIVGFFGGHKSNTSAILNGKRPISKEQAKNLAKFFNVSAELFI